MDSRKSDSAYLMRNRLGDAIHRFGCQHVRPGAVRWEWADANPDVDWGATAPWLKVCKTCNPPSPLSAGF